MAALGRMTRQPLASLMTIMVIAIALALPAAFALLVTNARAATGSWDSAIELSVYFKRDVGVAIRLDSPKVSRNHARIVVNGNEVVIEDLSSKNGTFVRGSRIEAPTTLAPGDEIQVGPVRLRLRIDEHPGNTLTEAWTRDA